MNATEVWNEIVELRKKALAVTKTAVTRWKQANQRARIIARNAGRVVDTVESQPSFEPASVLLPSGTHYQMGDLEKLNSEELDDLFKNVRAEREALDRQHEDERDKLDNEANALANYLPEELPPSHAERAELRRELAAVKSELAELKSGVSARASAI